MTKTELLAEKQQLEYCIDDHNKRLTSNADLSYKQIVRSEMEGLKTRLFQVDDLIKQFNHFEKTGSYAYWND